MKKFALSLLLSTAAVPLLALSSGTAFAAACSAELNALEMAFEVESAICANPESSPGVCDYARQQTQYAIVDYASCMQFDSGGPL